MKIADIRATTVTMPLEAPLRHSNGAHWGRFVRTIVEVEADNGLIGLGEMGGGGESAEAAVAGSGLPGRPRPGSRRRRCGWSRQPDREPYNNRTQLLAAVEFACLDLLGQDLGVPVYELLGGKVRDGCRSPSYLFFRHAGRGRPGEVRTAEQLVAHARELAMSTASRVHKLKGGVFPPDYELECFRALAEAFPGDRVRFDPNGALAVEEAIRFAAAIEDLDNDYFEDPT